MTCIVALKHGGKVWMGADSAGVGGYSLTVRKDRKIHRVGPMLIGFTTSFRMGQLLGYKLSIPPHHPDVDTDKYMVTSFVDAVRTALKDGGWVSKDKEQEQGGRFIVAYQGRIFDIDSDFQVGEPVGEFSACGCGQDIALGSLHASAKTSEPPDYRLTLALEAAQEFSAGVRAPFYVESI